jgi:uncharacterized protein (TIGR02569 family)
VPTDPPEHVRVAFGVVAATPQHLPGGQGRAWRCGDAVLKPVDDAAEASWLASTLEQLRVDGIRVARPIRSSDGRWVVAGWTAQRFVSGRPAPRYAEIVAAGDALHRALAGIPRPRFMDQRHDLYSWSDRLAWGPAAADPGLGDGHGAQLYAELAAGRRAIDVPDQLVHGDLFGNVLFAGSAPPAVIDIAPYWRPTGWAAAVAVVDAVTWGGADTALLTEYQDRSDWPQLLRRAVMFRLAVSLAHPRTTPESLVEMLAAAELIRPLLD